MNHHLAPLAQTHYRTIDDAPFGGGAGMVMKAEPLFRSVEAAQPPRPLFLLGPGGRRFDQAMAHQLADGAGFSLICGRYEGVDHRVREHLVDGELSVGDVVLNGGGGGGGPVGGAGGGVVAGGLGEARGPRTRRLRRPWAGGGAADHRPLLHTSAGRRARAWRSGGDRGAE